MRIGSLLQHRRSLTLVAALAVGCTYLYLSPSSPHTHSPSTPTEPASHTMAPQVLTIPARSLHTTTVVFLHGLGDSGHGWSFLPELFATQNVLPHVKWVLPSAPNTPVTLNGGMSMPSWYDIYTLDRINAREDDAGMLRTVAFVHGLLDKEVADGKKVVVAGFSQGCAMSLLSGLTYKRPIAAIVGMSGYLPLRDRLAELGAAENRQTPIWMGHGTSDPVVDFNFGKMSADKLKEAGYNVEFKSYAGLAHGADPRELGDMAKFLDKLTT